MAQTFLTCKEAAAELNVTDGRVRQLLMEGRIWGARKFGRDWLIPSPIRVQKRKLGRPAGAAGAKKKRKSK